MLMLGFDRRAARYVWTSALVVLLLVLVYLVRSTLFIFILALLFAYLLAPLVNALDRVLPASRTRTPALAVAYVIFVAAVVIAGMQIGTRVVEQANTLATDFPGMLARWEHPSPGASPAVNSFKAQVIEKVRASLAERSSDLISSLPKAGRQLFTLLGNLVFVVIIPILAFFFLKDAREVRQSILELLEEGPHRALLDDVLTDIDVLLAHYMRALIGLSLAALTAYGVFFSIVGVPYGILLAVLAAVLEFIPMVGPLGAVVVILLVTVVSGGHVLAILIFLCAYRVFQDYLLSPHLMGRGVELHPLVVLFGVFAGAEVAGIPGTFLSVPLLALVRVLYIRMRKARLLRTALAAPPVTAPE
jgi:predicted PurR-regulated permease PerM